MCKCEICGKDGMTERGLKIHMTRMHKDEDKPVVPENVEVAVQEAAETVADGVPVEAPTEEEMDRRANLVDIAVSGLKTVTLNSEIVISGPCWFQGTPDSAWEEQVADELRVVVASKELTGSGKVQLLCRVPGGQAIWAVLEEDVTNGRFPCVQVGAAEVVDDRPADGPREVPLVEDTGETRQVEFRYALNEYHEVNQSKLAAEKKHKLVSKEQRPIIESYIMDFGEESEEGKLDKVVYECGLKAHMMRVPPKVFVEQDVRGITAWCIDNGREDLLEYTVNLEKWDEAKEADEIPEETIRELEIPKETEEKFRLRVDVDKSKNK